MNDWRARLRQAVQRSGKKHSALAMDAGIAQETLSRILNDRHARPSFETIVRIVHASGETVGWLLDERGYMLSSYDLQVLRKASEFMAKVLRMRDVTDGS